ncbi:MAG: Uncharacterised protein [Flavobacterium sp. SCGC AAA160-P02]|nr:MAG: Uncharacterised protein [Flavobacterium sp. SCGC AAA160-P02]
MLAKSYGKHGSISYPSIGVKTMVHKVLIKDNYLFLGRFF